MKAFQAPLTTLLAALLWSHVGASPAVPALPLEPRRQTAEITNEIIKIFGEIFKGVKLAFPDKINAWDYQSNGNLCEIYMETTNGANCYAAVTCNDGKKEYNAGKGTWNACFQHGRQYFNDPRIGDFSITFQNRDGGEGAGLTGPLLQVKDIGNWMEIPVASLATKNWHDEDCRDHNGIKCDDGPYICYYPQYDIKVGRTRKWICGVPKRGQNFQDQNTNLLDSNKPTNSRDYAPGWCGVHVTQYQKPDPSKDQYALAATLFDSNQNLIGDSGGKQGATLVFNSKLPLPFVVKSRAVDADPLDFEYDNVRWDSNETPTHHCSVGAYDKGKREMDCGFQCN